MIGRPGKKPVVGKKKKKSVGVTKQKKPSVGKEASNCEEARGNKPTPEKKKPVA